MNNEITAFGNFCCQYDHIPFCAELRFNIASINTYDEVIKWYVRLNTESTTTPKDIQRFEKLYKDTTSKSAESRPYRLM